MGPWQRRMTIAVLVMTGACGTRAAEESQPTVSGGSRRRPRRPPRPPALRRGPTPAFRRVPVPARRQTVPPHPAVPIRIRRQPERCRRPRPEPRARPVRRPEAEAVAPRPTGRVPVRVRPRSSPPHSPARGRRPRSTVLVASVGTFSGPAGTVIAPVLSGAQLWVKFINDRGANVTTQSDFDVILDVDGGSTSGPSRRRTPFAPFGRCPHRPRGPLVDVSTSVRLIAGGESWVVFRR